MTTVISFIKLDKEVAKTTPKHELEANALEISLFVSNEYVSEKSYKTIHRIMKKQMHVNSNEILLSKFIQKAPMCEPEQIEQIDNTFIELENSMLSDDERKTHMRNEVLRKLHNCCPN